MRQFKNYLLAATTLVILAGALTLISPSPDYAQQPRPPAPVTVVNSATEPVPTAAQGTTAIRNVDNPAREPVRFFFFVGLENGESSGTNSVPLSNLVPAGKRLVIEYVTVLASVPGDQQASAELHTATSTGGFTSAYFFPLTFQGSTGFIGSKSWVGSHVTRIYVPIHESDVVLGAGFIRDSTSGSATLRLTIVGHLVNIS